MKRAGCPLWVLIIAGMCTVRMALVRVQGQEADREAEPVHWTLTTSVLEGSSIGKGTAVTACLHAAIEPGWHVYSLHQERGGPSAMRISLPAREPFAISGDLDARPPKSAIDPGFGMETHFYSDDVEVMIPLRATRKTVEPVELDVFYQACNRETCLRPTMAHLKASEAKQQEEKP